MHTHTHRFSTRAQATHTNFQAHHQVSLQVAYWKEKETQTKQAYQQKNIPQTNTTRQKPPHLTPQESSKSNQEGAFTSEVRGRCVSSGDPRCSISLEFVKELGRAGGREKSKSSHIRKKVQN